MLLQYSSAREEKSRFELFQKALLKIDALNARLGSTKSGAVQGITIFSDLSDDEFKMQYLSSMSPDLESSEFLYRTIPRLQMRAPKTAVNWAGIYTTPVKNQGQCGSSW